MAERRLARCGEYPSVLYSTTGLPTLIDSSAPGYPIQSLPDRPEQGRPVPGREGPAAGELRRWGIAARRALGKLSASVRQIGIRRRTSVRVKQSKSQQIVPNAYASGSTIFAMRSCLRASLSQRDIADVDRDRWPFGCGAPIENATPTVGRKVFEFEAHLRTKLFNRSSRKDQQPKHDLPKIAHMIHYTPSWRAGRHFTLSSLAILFTEHAAPCRKPLSRMLIHPVGKLWCAH
jgi:hypothetical protein